MSEPGEETARAAIAAIDTCHCSALRRASRRLSQYYDAVLAPTGLRISQLSILATICALDGPTIGRLSREIDLDRTTTGKNLRPLERAGLIVTTRSAADMRSRVVAVTSAGRRVLTDAEPLWREAQRSYEALNGLDAVLRSERALAGFAIPKHGGA